MMRSASSWGIRSGGFVLKNLFSQSIRRESPENNYYKAIKAYKLNPQQDFSRLRSEIGLDAATEYAHLYFSHLKLNQKLRREIELHPYEYNQLNSSVDVMIIPPPHALITEEIFKKHIQPFSPLATSCGFAHVSLLEMKVDSVHEGARRLLKVIQDKAKNQKKVLLISLSYGSAFVRLMLDHANETEKASVKGWMNLSGLIFGSPRFHCSDRAFWTQKVSRLQRSFSSEQKYFLTPLSNLDVKTIHFLGLQIGQQQGANRKEREYLKAWGPNDGLVPFYRYQNLTHPVFSFAGDGHWISISDHASFFAKTMSAMVSVLPVDQRKVNRALSAKFDMDFTY